MNRQNKILSDPQDALCIERLLLYPRRLTGPIDIEERDGPELRQEPLVGRQVPDGT